MLQIICTELISLVSVIYEVSYSLLPSNPVVHEEEKIQHILPWITIVGKKIKTISFMH